MEPSADNCIFFPPVKSSDFISSWHFPQSAVTSANTAGWHQGLSDLKSSAGLGQGLKRVHEILLQTQVIRDFSLDVRPKKKTSRTEKQQKNQQTLANTSERAALNLKLCQSWRYLKMIRSVSSCVTFTNEFIFGQNYNHFDKNSFFRLCKQPTTVRLMGYFSWWGAGGEVLRTTAVMLEW